MDEQENHPDAPGGRSVEEELNAPTRESFETLGHADLEDEPDLTIGEADDEASPPGQNSDWSPQ